MDGAQAESGLRGPSSCACQCPGVSLGGPGEARLLQEVRGAQQSLAWQEVMTLDTEAGKTEPVLVSEVAIEQTYLQCHGKGLFGHAIRNPASDNCQLCDFGHQCLNFSEPQFPRL